MYTVLNKVYVQSLSEAEGFEKIAVEFNSCVL